MTRHSTDDELDDPTNDDARDDADSTDGDSDPEELRQKVYPLAPDHRISEGKIARLSIWRISATGKQTLITSQACPLKTTWAEIKRVCGGGTYTVKPVSDSNRFVGSRTETQSGRPVADSEIQWPNELVVGGGVSEKPVGPSDAEASPDAEAGLDRRERERREWELRIERERREWERDQAERKERAEAAARREAEAHDLRMQSLREELASRTAEKTAATTVEIKRLELDAELQKTRLSIEGKSLQTKDAVDRLLHFAEKVGEKIIEKHPEKIGRVLADITGSKLEENAKHAVREQAKAISEEMGDSIVAAALEKADKRQGELLAQHLLKNPEQAKEVLEALRRAAGEST